ncbi:hypothetical protein O4H61_14055 [Roseovarius aestuarii]|nr:hypothetical protein [Roseovarius aestuarii]
MTVLNTRLVRHILALLACIAIFNPIVVGLFDPHPPLDDVELFLIALVDVIALIVVVLSYFFGTRLVLINFAVVLVTLVLIDLLLRALYPRFDHQAFLRTTPQPYQDAAYFSPELLDEMADLSGNHYMAADSNKVYLKDFEGRWYNVVDGHRKTVDQPENAQRKIYLFGGSTVFNIEVPDEYTIASQLQKMVNRVTDSTAVINMGVTSIDSGQQLSRLVEDIRLQPQDIVLFYDGVNDVMQRVVYENQDGYMIGRPKEEPFLPRLLRKLAGELAIFRVALNQAERDKAIDPEVINSATDAYLSVLNTAQAFSLDSGATFYHFLQPTIYTKRETNTYENSILDRDATSGSQLVKSAYEQTYPVFQSALSNVPFSTDLTAAFDGLDPSPYLDFCHINHVGNRVIAESIFQTISGEFSN